MFFLNIYFILYLFFKGDPKFDEEVRSQSKVLLLPLRIFEVTTEPLFDSYI